MKISRTKRIISFIETAIEKYPKFQELFPTGWISFASLIFPIASGLLISLTDDFWIRFWIVIITIVLSFFWYYVFHLFESAIINLKFKNAENNWELEKSNFLFSLMEDFANYNSKSGEALFYSLGLTIGMTVQKYLNLSDRLNVPFSVSIYGYDLKSKKIRRVYGMSYLSGIKSPGTKQPFNINASKMKDRFYVKVLKDPSQFPEDLCFDLTNENNRKLFNFGSDNKAVKRRATHYRGEMFEDKDNSLRFLIEIISYDGLELNKPSHTGIRFVEDTLSFYENIFCISDIEFTENLRRFINNE